MRGSTNLEDPVSTDRKTVTDQLLLQHPAPPMEDPVSRVGGWPLVPRGCRWPPCGQCGVPMQFLLQLRMRDFPEVFGGADGLLLVWRCYGEERACEGARPYAMDSLAVLVSMRDLVLLTPPDGGRRPEPPYTLFGCEALRPSPLVRPLRSAFDSEEEWRQADPYQTIRDLDQRGVAGLVTRHFDWVGEPEHVECAACRLDMTPVLQLEGQAGGGSFFTCGYVLFCRACAAAVWLAQHDDWLEALGGDGIDPDDIEGN